MFEKRKILRKPVETASTQPLSLLNVTHFHTPSNLGSSRVNVRRSHYSWNAVILLDSCICKTKSNETKSKTESWGGGGGGSGGGSGGGRINFSKIIPYFPPPACSPISNLCQPTYHHHHLTLIHPNMHPCSPAQYLIFLNLLLRVNDNGNRSALK